MNPEMTFDWSRQLDDLPADSLNRSIHAEFLTEFLISKSKDSSYVLNINSSWGAGKTWFLRRWVASIKNHYPTVYVDCWKNDHSNDPFLTVISQIKSSLIEKTDKKFINSSAFNKSWKLFKNVAPTIFKTILKNKSGIDWDGFDDIEGVDDCGEKIVDTIINAHEETSKSIDDFKTSISEWLIAVNNQDDNFEMPLFVFIDELDRCRPTYAIQMLETVKHIFDIPNVVFVIATDKEQLQHSIKAVYGQGFNSNKYLDRFFNRSVSLRQVSLKKFIDIRMNSNASYDTLNKSNCSLFHPESSLTIKERCRMSLTFIADLYQMDLRTTNLWLDRIDSIVFYSKASVDLFFIAYMIATEMKEPRFYEELVYGSLDKEDNYRYIFSKYKPNSYLLEFSINSISHENLSVQVSTYGDHELVRFEVNPLKYITFLISMLKGEINHRVLNQRENQLLDMIGNGDFRSSKLNGDSVHVPSLNQPYSIPLAAEICLVEYHLRNKMTFERYIDLCELATIIE